MGALFAFTGCAGVVDENVAAFDDADGGVTASLVGDVTLVPSSATWRYVEGSAPAGWQNPSFSDTAWKSGKGEFGFGEGDETTVIDVGNPRRIAFYFRTSFNVPAAGAYTTIRARFVRDDGVVMYLNGTEFARNNMPSGTITSTTTASSWISVRSDELVNYEVTIPTSLLKTGTNVFAVELHQAGASSGDATFKSTIVATASKCVIGGATYADSVKTPANVCQVCSPMASTTAWSAIDGCTVPAPTPTPTPTPTPGTGPLSLGATGKTIPDTNYAIPAGGIFMATTGSDGNAGTQAAPVKTLNRAVALAPAGGTIVVRGGVYRDWYSNSGGTAYAAIGKALTYQAYPHEQVWFDGTDVIPTASWTASGTTWSLPWSTPHFCDGNYYSRPLDQQDTASNAGPCAHADMSKDPTNPMAVDPQMVFIDGTNLRQVKTLAEVTSSAFFYDWTNKKLYIGQNPSGHTVEVAKRNVALVISTSAAKTKLLGLGFRRYASNEYHNATASAVYDGGTASTVENCVFTLNAGQGLYVQAQGSVVRSSVFAKNGYNGLGSNGHFRSGAAVRDDLLIEGNMVNANNTEKFGTNCTISCGQAGVHLAHMNGYVARNNVLSNNNGGGLWCDLACTDGIMVKNYAHHNTEMGLFYEVSDRGLMASNLLVTNGTEALRVASANTKVYNNTIINCLSSSDTTNPKRQGPHIYDDSRSLNVGGWTDVGPDTKNTEFVNNIVVGCGIMLKLEKANRGTFPPNTKPEQFFTALDYNAYYRLNGQTLVSWISDANVNYGSASAFASAQGWDSHAIDVGSGADPFFTNLGGGDFTVRGNSTAYRSGKALPTDVAAALGVAAGTIPDRGAISWPGR